MKRNPNEEYFLPRISDGLSNEKARRRTGNDDESVDRNELVRLVERSVWIQRKVWRQSGDELAYFIIQSDDFCIVAGLSNLLEVMHDQADEVRWTVGETSWQAQKSPKKAHTGGGAR